MLKNEYLMRHNKVCGHLPYSMCKAPEIETTHTHTHNLVNEQEDVTVLWNQAANTGREVTANRPDIIIKNKEEKRCILIVVPHPQTEMS